MLRNADTEGGRDGICRDVIMRRANAARGEDVGVFRPQGVYCGNNLVLDIWHGAAFHDGDTERLQILSDLLQVDVPGAAGEKFVPDQEDGGCGLACHALPSATPAEGEKEPFGG